MATTILGLDIGGANLKAATASKQAISVPFPLWKQPDKLPAALAELVAKFPDVEELAVTMTGELCDCFETKRDGVNAIIKAVRFASDARPIHVWSTDGMFLNSEEAKQNHMRVAAANWHALATFAGRYAPEGRAILVDVGSTTTDIIPILDGKPVPEGKTDYDRLVNRELVYIGVRRTPLCAVWPGTAVCAELFATTQDVLTLTGFLPQEPNNRDTADGRPLTTEYSLARLARILGGDREQFNDDDLFEIAFRIRTRIKQILVQAAHFPANHEAQYAQELRTVIVSGAGELLARDVATAAFPSVSETQIISLNHELGSDVSACAPAYAVAVLAAERRP